MADLQQITQSSFQVIQFAEKCDAILRPPFIDLSPMLPGMESSLCVITNRLVIYMSIKSRGFCCNITFPCYSNYVNGNDNDYVQVIVYHLNFMEY